MTISSTTDPPKSDPAAAPTTVVARFWDRVHNQPDRPALRHHGADGEWEALTWGDYGNAVAEIGGGLIDLGIEPGDRVGLLSSNRPEWHIADLAILSVGAVTVPIYPTSSSSQAAYVLRDSESRVCFVDSSEQLAKVLLHYEELPSLERVVGLVASPGLDRAEIMVDIADIGRRGRAVLDADSAAVSSRAESISGDDLVTLVYTSGTTGPPKGTSLSHANIGWTLDAVESMVGLAPTERFLSYLPLSHIAERVTSHFGQITAGGETWFARSLATVPEDLQACRPTVFFAVPRVWQKLRDAILDRIGGQPRPVRALFEKYQEYGQQVVAPDHDDPERSLRDRLEHATLDKTIGAKLRHQLGLDQARLLISAAAPIHPDLVRWFHAIGLPIAEVYGQTEDCGPATINPPDDIRIGTVGVPLPGLEVEVADDGELLIRGGSVCVGYHGRPDATAELIDAEGWMHTGDLGSIDDDGYVRITGRKKDLIINAAGKNISPSEIEARLAMEPLVGQAVVVGDGQRYLVALLTLDPDEAADWAEAHDAFADVAGLVQDDRLKEAVEECVQRANREHAPVEQIKKWRLLPEQLTVEGGELTPTMKVKRNVVQERFADLVDAMYAE